MITESIDDKSGIIRFEINTVSPDACRNEIENSGFVVKKVPGGDAIRYLVKYKGVDLDVRSTPTRTLIFGLNRYAMKEFFDEVSGDEAIGTAWAYDDTKRSDYQSK